MSFTESRRDFVLSGARAGAAAAVVGAMPAAFAATSGVSASTLTQRAIRSMRFAWASSKACRGRQVARR
jgi:hypothetical protein